LVNLDQLSDELVHERKYISKISVLHQAPASLRKLESFRLHGYTQRHGCVIRKKLDPNSHLIRKDGEPFPLTVRSISPEDYLSDNLLNPILQHFSSSNVTTIKLKDIQWSCTLFTYPLPPVWSIHEILLQTLEIEHIMLRDVLGSNPDYTKWIPLVASLRPKILVVKHAAAKSDPKSDPKRPRYSSLRDDPAASLVTIEKQGRALQLANDHLLDAFNPILWTLYAIFFAFRKRVIYSSTVAGIPPCACVQITVLAERVRIGSACGRTVLPY
jgi:hypothetical protein